MNRYILVTLLLLTGNFSKAQQPKIEFSTNPYLGYETNILQSPSRYTATDQNLNINDLWVNAPYLGVKNRLKISDQKKKNTFLFSGNYRKAIITSTDEVRASDLYTGATYRFYNKKKVKNEVKIDFRNYVKTGEDQDNLIGVPLSYNRLRLTDELKIRMSKKFSFQFTPNLTLKNYQREGFDRFMYFEQGAETGLLYRYNYKRKVGLGLFLDVSQRNYLISKEMEDDLEDEEFEDEAHVTKRTWRYFSGGIGVAIPIQDKMKLKIRGDYTHRADVLQNSLGYHQYELSFRLNYKYKKWKWISNSSIQFRDYTHFKVSDGTNQKLLDYTYIRYGFGATYVLSDRLNMTIRSDGKMRVSNANQVNRTAFRSYIRAEASIGIQYTFQSKSRTRTRKRN